MIRNTYFAAGVLLLSAFVARGADGIQSKTSYSKAYGQTKNAVQVDPTKDLPRYPAVEPAKAVATWKVKAGFEMQVAAQEPQVRDPVAICFDEMGRMFVCEMIDYSEMRDVEPHLGRISVLEDRDGDGVYETSTVFADNLPWPTGMIWSRGGLYVAATPDIWRLEDRDGDGRAEFREKVFTGFGTGLKVLNVQGLLNSFQWGQDNRIHALCGGGNRGEISCLKRPEIPAQELAGRDFWFDPATYDFGFENGGAQYGMSFDNYGRKFGCANSDHLQYWIHDGVPASRNPLFTLPAARQSIAADGGAAEVFRISPDEPWRIMRTRWRIEGTVPGAVEGGGRVSGYFTGATGTTIYRGDAYGQDFVNNSFTGDAGGQLVHRKIIRPTVDGVNLVGERPADERTLEFAASTDTWVRVVNFANAPDGCLYVCDMYREVIEHPWSIPEEIKKHIDLNNGNDRGRIYRIAPLKKPARIGAAVNLGAMDTRTLVATLAHPNGWHRDTAHRLLVERKDAAAGAHLREAVTSGPELQKLHSLGVLSGIGALTSEVLCTGLRDNSAFVRERSLRLVGALSKTEAREPSLLQTLAGVASDVSPRVRFQLALTLGSLLETVSSKPLADALLVLARRDHAHPWIGPALLSGSPASLVSVLFAPLAKDAAFIVSGRAFFANLVEINAASASTGDRVALVDYLTDGVPSPVLVRAFAEGVRKAGASLESADPRGRLKSVFEKAAEAATLHSNALEKRLAALELLAVAPNTIAAPALAACIAGGEADALQTAAIEVLSRNADKKTPATLLAHWSSYGTRAREAVLGAMLGREDRIETLLSGIKSGAVPATALSAAQVQGLVRHKNKALVALAQTALAAVLPPPRSVVVDQFKAAATTVGDAARGRVQFLQRCQTCHRAGAEGIQVGPDLVTVKNKGREALLTAILEPNKEVASQYILHTVNLRDGTGFSGIIAEDGAENMTLKMPGGLTQIIARAQIKSSSSEGQSLMPEGIEAGMSVQEMADLLQFIETLP